MRIEHCFFFLSFKILSEEYVELNEKNRELIDCDWEI